MLGIQYCLLVSYRSQDTDVRYNCKFPSFTNLLSNYQSDLHRLVIHMFSCIERTSLENLQKNTATHQSTTTTKERQNLFLRILWRFVFAPTVHIQVFPWFSLMVKIYAGTVFCTTSPPRELSFVYAPQSSWRRLHHFNAISTFITVQCK